jgi:hypothetical protein
MNNLIIAAGRESLFAERVRQSLKYKDETSVQSRILMKGLSSERQQFRKVVSVQTLYE